jgi:hypothetical protein
MGYEVMVIGCHMMSQLLMCHGKKGEMCHMEMSE